jgi:hypothetical protein
MDVAKGKETGNTESDIGMTLGARGNPTDVTGNKEIVRDNYEGIAKVLDLTGGKETDRVNDCIAVRGTPDSNPVSSCSAPAASRLNGCRRLDSANKSTFSLEGYTSTLVALSFHFINVHFLIKLLTYNFYRFHLSTR